MSTNHDSNSSRHCIDCKQVVLAGQKKCAVCGSFQDWRRYLSVSSTLLSLLVALISVTGVVAPILKDTLTREESAVVTRVSSGKNGQIRLVAQNAGSAAGFLGDVRIITDGAKHIASSGGFVAVQPNNFELKNINLDREYTRFMASAGKCLLEVEILNHKLQIRVERHDLKCFSSIE